VCGITGIVARRNIAVTREEIAKLNGLISHRGPDDEGYYFGDNFALGHRRLSILDLSPDGHQPMEYAGRYVITYNGEVYNYIEIRSELEQLGHRFYSRTDTEVILAAYAEWGAACVQRFNGMWAFAIYDMQAATLFLSRDRFGIKPLYYLWIDDGFYFGSEIRQLLEVTGRAAVNEKVLLDYLASNFIDHTDETFFSGIVRLPASHSMLYDLKRHSFETKRYYRIPRWDSGGSAGREDIQVAAKTYHTRLLEAIRLRLRSDVKVGTCLSGGLDSSSVSTLAAREYAARSEKQFTAITAKSVDREVDESEYAREVARNVNMNWRVVQPDYRAFSAVIDEVVQTQEEPFGGPSIFMQYFVMQEAKNCGCKVMLDGQGGDETLLGYERYCPSAYLDILRRRGVFAAVKAIRDTLRNNSVMNLYRITQYGIGSLVAPIRKHYNLLLCRFIKRDFRPALPHLKELARAYRDVFELQVMEITRTNLPELLRYEDRNSMHFSVEARLPMIDYRVLEQALNTDTELKIANGWTKYLLRMAMHNVLPSSITWRRHKLGFNAPERSWLENHYDAMLEEVGNSALLAHYCDMSRLLKDFPSLNKELRWRLYNIACWERLFNVSAN